MNIKRQSALNKKQNKVNTTEKNCMLPKENKLVCLANRYCVLFEWNAQLNNHKIILMKLFVTKTIDRESKKVNIHVIWLELIGFAVLSLSKKRVNAFLLCLLLRLVPSVEYITITYTTGGIMVVVTKLRWNDDEKIDLKVRPLE